MQLANGPNLYTPAFGAGVRIINTFAFALVSLLPVSLAAQKPKPAPSTPSAEQQLQQHYGAARTFQISGDTTRAASEYRIFLAEALGAAANARAAAGDFGVAAGLFEESLQAVPDNTDVRLSYAMLQFQQQKIEESQKNAEQVLKVTPKNIQTLLLLGRLAYQKADYKAAREYLETAVVAAPGFDVGYLLGMTYVKLNDSGRARVLFDEMVTGIGDSPQIHIYFGRAYAVGDTDGLENAIQEFKRAIAKDSKVHQAHYFLALAYLNRDGESGFANAASALRAELGLSPNDARSRYLLGYIAMKQRQSAEAETELRLAAKLDPENPDALIFLGQLYSEMNRDIEAEAALRKAIVLTKDISRGDYQINRAHYVLGRILLRSDRKVEGEKELALSKELRDHVRNFEKIREELSVLDPSSQTGAVNPESVSPAGQKKADAFVNQLRPAIADAYNNLGVIHAGEKQFPAALDEFKKAREWQPSLATVDRNIGMAAFYDNQFGEAVEPLSRHVSQHEEDLRARAALGLSYFMTQKFPLVLETLRPIQASVDADTGLAYAYAVSLVKTGNYNEGVRRLKALETTQEKSAEVHALLGQAYADQNEYNTAAQEYRKSLASNSNQPQTHYLLGLALLKSGSPADAVEEFRTALKMSPNDASKKYHLAFSLIQLQQKDEGRELLREVIEQDPKYADAYYELGKLQLEQGETKAAIGSFEIGARLSPDSDYIHYQLAMAYRRESRVQDAEREIKLYQALKNRHRGRDVPEVN
jgi:tetratricopeptide (TPR) repeat protein